MRLLTTPIQPYAWGSRSALAKLQERAIPTDQPEAELWVGAHPKAPSRFIGLAGEPSLAEVITRDPRYELGEACQEQFGAHLPFLVKVLAADAPLSIQVHPNAEQARAGFEFEESRGIPIDDPRRNYADASHKPELLYAINDFEALCGFRPAEQAYQLLVNLDVDVLEPLANRLLSPDGYREVFTEFLTSSHSVGLLDKVITACRSAEPSAFSRDYELAVSLAERYPGDVGVLVTLLLNHVFLTPGQAMFVPAGVLHAYLGGVAIEVMASSDNVLRGGLTPKHVDVRELLRVVRPEPTPPDWVKPIPLSPGVQQWRTPVSEFVLTRVDVVGAPVHIPVSGPRVVLCMRGSLIADSELAVSSPELGTNSVSLSPGQAAYCSAGEGELVLLGAGVAFVASPAASVEA